MHSALDGVKPPRPGGHPGHPRPLGGCVPLGACTSGGRGVLPCRVGLSPPGPARAGGGTEGPHPRGAGAPQCPQGFLERHWHPGGPPGWPTAATARSPARGAGGRAAAWCHCPPVGRHLLRSPPLRAVEHHRREMRIGAGWPRAEVHGPYIPGGSWAGRRRCTSSELSRACMLACRYAFSAPDEGALRLA